LGSEAKLDNKSTALSVKSSKQTKQNISHF